MLDALLTGPCHLISLRKVTSFQKNFIIFQESILTIFSHLCFYLSSLFFRRIFNNIFYGLLRFISRVKCNTFRNNHPMKCASVHRKKSTNSVLLYRDAGDRSKMFIEVFTVCYLNLKNQRSHYFRFTLAMPIH